MPTPEQDLQQHLQGYEQFTTTVEGIELLCLMEYEPAYEYDEKPYPETAWCEYVLLNGQDIKPLMHEKVLDAIAERYLIELDMAADEAKTEKRIEALESAA